MTDVIFLQRVGMLSSSLKTGMTKDTFSIGSLAREKAKLTNFNLKTRILFFSIFPA